MITSSEISLVCEWIKESNSIKKARAIEKALRNMIDKGDTLEVTKKHQHKLLDTAKF